MLKASLKVCSAVQKSHFLFKKACGKQCCFLCVIDDGTKGIYRAYLIIFSNMLVAGIHITQGKHQSKTSVNRVLVLTLENKRFPIGQ